MPWEKNPKYRNKKNAQLLWLMDNPESKYNNPDFIMGIKKIERMSDLGISKEARQNYFEALCKRCEITKEEGLYFIQPEFLE